ncbi:hypothetical protein T484DRAFT_1952164 [Baffinella frigidus]|nr:hypothetical protein T484DRAFT_1952164 [Cryptophyta sp. CCMP2293]
MYADDQRSVGTSWPSPSQRARGESDDERPFAPPNAETNPPSSSDEFEFSKPNSSSAIPESTRTSGFGSWLMRRGFRPNVPSELHDSPPNPVGAPSCAETGSAAPGCEEGTPCSICDSWVVEASSAGGSVTRASFASVFSGAAGATAVEDAFSREAHEFTADAACAPAHSLPGGVTTSPGGV